MNKVNSVAVIILSAILPCFCIAQTNNHANATNKSSSIIVSTKDGFVKGMAESHNLAIFLGIPYATPPTGNLRWEKPLPLKYRHDTLQVVNYGPACPQPKKSIGPTSEDCLYLNIFTTLNGTQKKTAKKAVMFWIHGGGFVGGSAEGYDGRILAGKDVVVVTINYRIGPFGYLFHPALEASSANEGAGNYGLLDQVAALKWVHQNIASFGGDPDNVTIWGESAGAFSVGALLASPLAKGLFHKAILQSGTGLINGIQTKESALRYGIDVAKKAGIEGNDSNALNALYALSAERLVEIFSRPNRPQLQAFYVWSSPVIDGWALPLPLDKAIDQNKWNNVPLLVGSNMDEGAYFQREMPAHSVEEYYELLGNKSLGDTTGILKLIYKVKDTSEIFSRSQELVGDYGFGGPARALARMATVKDGKAYVYYFTRTSIDKNGNTIKSLHSTELPFVFGYTEAQFQPYNWVNGINPIDSLLAEKMSDYWSNFAKYGNPNGKNKNIQIPQWPLYEIKTNSYLEIGEQIKPLTNLRKVQYDVIDQFSKQKGEIRY